MDSTPPMPATEAEWVIHWAIYKLTVSQRDAAWRELEESKSAYALLRAGTYRAPGT